MKYLQNIILSVLVLLSIPTAFVMISVYWLETRFGKNAAALTMGGVAVLVVVAITAAMIIAVVWITMRASADHTQDVADAFKATSRLEQKQWDIVKNRERHTQQIEMVDYKRIDKIAQERAKLLSERQDPEDDWWAQQGASNVDYREVE